MRDHVLQDQEFLGSEVDFALGARHAPAHQGVKPERQQRGFVRPVFEQGPLLPQQVVDERPVEHEQRCSISSEFRYNRSPRSQACSARAVSPSRNAEPTISMKTLAKTFARE